MNVHFSLSGDFIYDDLFDIFVLRHMTYTSNELWTSNKTHNNNNSNSSKKERTISSGKKPKQELLYTFSLRW